MGKELPVYETGDVINGLLKVPVVGGFRALKVVIGLVGDTEVKWVPPENYSGIDDRTPLSVIYETRRNLEIVQEICEKGIIFLLISPC